MTDIMEGIKPTRMELLKLRKRVFLARRGHKLLKEKRDALISEFLAVAGKVRSTRKETEIKIQNAYKNKLKAEAVMGAMLVSDISWNTAQNINISMKTRNIMGVSVPIIEMGDIERNAVTRGYGFGDTSAALDDACTSMERVLADVIKLAEAEETVRRLALEVEKTKRRVNALEYILIPRLNATLKYIIMRLDEMERESFIRLKKIKAVLESQSNKGSG